MWNVYIIRSAGLETLLLVGVSTEVPRKGELAELVANHILGHEDVRKLTAVVNLERVSNELRHNRA